MCVCVCRFLYALLIFYVDWLLLSVDCCALVRQTAESAGIAIGSGRNGKRQTASPASSTARRSHLIDSCLPVTSVKMTHRVLVTGKHKSQQTPTELERESLPQQKKITTKQKNKAQTATATAAASSQQQAAPRRVAATQKLCARQRLAPTLSHPRTLGPNSGNSGPITFAQLGKVQSRLETLQSAERTSQSPVLHSLNLCAYKFNCSTERPMN